MTYRTCVKGHVIEDDTLERCPSCRRSIREATGTVPTATEEPEPAVEVSTLEYVPGREVTGVLGLVTGHVVISRGAFSDLGSDIKSVFGGNLGGIEAAIQHALELSRRRLKLNAEKLGADAVLGVRVTLETAAEKAQAIVMFGTAVSTVLTEKNPR